MGLPAAPMKGKEARTEMDHFPDRYVAVSEAPAKHYVRDTRNNTECPCTHYTLRSTAEADAASFNRCYRSWCFATELYLARKRRESGCV